MNLTSTTHSLELVTAAATEVVYGASWTEIDKTTGTVVTPGSAQGSVSAIGVVTVVPAPSSASVYRVVTSFWAKATGGAQLVEAQKDVGGTNYPITPGDLAVDESLHYDASGWYVLDATGSRKGVGATGAAGTNGGGTVLGSGTALVDFGSGANMATVDVTGEAAILSDSLVFCWIKPEATADHTEGEHIVEDIKVVASDIVAGVGFTIWAFSPDRPLPPERPLPSLLGRSSGAGAATGGGQASKDPYRTVPGRTALLKGLWSVGWFYTQ